MGEERVKVGKESLLCKTLTGADVGPKLTLLSPPQPSVKGKKSRGAYAWQRFFRKKESNPVRVCQCARPGGWGNRGAGELRWFEHDDDVVANREHQGALTDPPSCAFPNGSLITSM